MELFEAITTRKTIREYENTQPPLEDIRRIINAARLAPSATNTQNWEFIAIYNKYILKKMSAAVIKKYEEISKLTHDEEVQNNITRMKNFAGFFKNAPVVIAIVETPRTPSMQGVLTEENFTHAQLDEMRPNSSLLSIGGAIENLLLAAHGLGYAGCWMCAPIVAFDEFKRLLNIPAENKVISLVPVGIPKNADTTTRVPKKSLEEVMRVID